MIIQWDNKLEIGNKLVDTEHRMLVMLFKKLDVAIKKGESDGTVRYIVLEVKKFSEFHFFSEENLMREVKYPELVKHEIVHSHLLSRLDVMIWRMNKRREFPDDLLYFLNNWLITHIGQEDTKIADYALHSKSRPVAEEIYPQFLA